MLNKLLEGLRPLDLQGMINPVLEIDSFKSKMGDDQDVCVVSFVAEDRFPAKDLMEFIEKGYNFVLDADVSAGEDNNGNYHVFVELPRTPKLTEQIKDMIFGIKKLTGIEDFKFKYHKREGVYPVNNESLSSMIPGTPSDYQNFLNEVKTESVKKFFNKTLMDDLTLDNNIITIHKPFGQKIHLEWLQEDDPQSILETAPAVDESSTAEVFWLTKVLGDYDISKFGDRFLFTNGEQAILLKRTVL